jgi:cytidylate kinase
MIRILTIEREYGSGGGEIAALVAKHLGWTLYDQLLTNEIARMMECDCKVIEEREEKRDPVFYRLLKAFMKGSHEGSQNAPRLKIVDAECIREATEKVVKHAAERGQCVIVGRGSAYYLQDRRDAFHVFVYAPFNDKVKRLRADGKPEKEAIHLAQTVDRDRAAFIEQYFAVEWPDRHRFHLMINSTMGEESVVETILEGIALFDKRGTGQAPPIQQRKTS